MCPLKPSLNQNKLLKPSLPKVKGFKIGLLNINGLFAHIDQLRLLLTDIHFDVLAINETKIDSSITSGLVGIDGYCLERNDRCKTGGGVALYIRNSINYVVREDIVPNNLEMVAIEISKPKTKPFIIST